MSRIRRDARVNSATNLAAALFGIVLVVSIALFARQLRISSAQAKEFATQGNYPEEASDSGEIGGAAVDTGSRSGSAYSSAGNIGLEGSNFRIEGNFLVADICYDLPSQEDWLLSRDTVLILKDRTVVVFEWGLIDWKYSESGERVRRCDDVNFWIQGIDDIVEFQIVVPRLETSWPSQLDCEAAQKKLDAINSGIQIECVQTDWSYGPEITSKPESLSEEAVQILVEEAFIEILEGPWVITGSLR